jgi:sulfide:quinone oxidoreductase
MSDVLILGGGFGGLAAAHRLKAVAPDLDITLIDRRERFHIGAAKLWDIVGIRKLEDSGRPLTGLDAKGIRFVRAEISAIDPRRRSVKTSEGEFESRFMIVGLGAAFAPPQTSMLQPPAFNLYDPQAIPSIRQALAGLDAGRIVVCVMGLPYKCPPAPYEAVMLIDEMLRQQGRRDRVELAAYTVQPSPLPVAGEEASKRVSAALRERGIELYPEHKLAGIDVSGGTADFGENGTVAFDVFLGVPRHVPPRVVADSPLAGEGGWIRPDRATMLTGFEGVWAIGDCVAIPNAVGEVPKAGVFAEAEGRVAADQILASLDKAEPSTFDGIGYCFLEFAGGRAAKVEGDFLAEPKPAVALAEPSEEIYAQKQAFVDERLTAWL